MAQSMGIDFALIHDVNNIAPIRGNSLKSIGKEPRLVGEVSGRTVLLVDDIAITGNTLIRAAEICMQHGAECVIALITHALFATNIENIADDHVDIEAADAATKSREMLTGISLLASNPNLSAIVVSNSLPNIAQNALKRFGSKRIVILDIAPLLAEAIRRIPLWRICLLFI